MKKLLLIFVLLTLTGCWNYRELNELAITTGIAVDKENGEYLTTFLISNSKGTSSSSSKAEASTAVYEGKGQTLYEAMKNTAAAVSKEIYLGHIDILILSEEVSKSDVVNVIDFLFRYPKTRNDFQLVLAKNCKASDILKITTPLESFPSQNVSQNLKVTDELQGFTYSVNFNDFVKLLLEDGINPVLPSVEIIGDIEEGNKNENIEQNEPGTYLKLNYLGLFKEDNFVAWSNLEESLGINIINNKINTAGVKTECNDGYVVTEITDMDTKIEKMDNKFKNTVKAAGSIQEVSCEIDLENDESINQINEKNKEIIIDYMDKAISLAKKNQTDIFGFGNIIYKKENTYWKKIKDSWENELFPLIEVEYSVDINLEAKGKINNYIEVRS